MTVKEKILHSLDTLDETSTYEDAMEKIVFLAKVDRGLMQLERGETVTHAEVRERMAKWLK